MLSVVSQDGGALYCVTADLKAGSCDVTGWNGITVCCWISQDVDGGIVLVAVRLNAKWRGNWI